jgi:rhodanese-related sulfurtransferase
MFGRSKSGSDVAPAEAIDRQKAGAVLLDVREDDEWAAGHAPGAVHLPLSRVGMSLARFQNQEVLTVCRSGGRSLRAAKQLADAGIDVHKVRGGMTSWESWGLPVVRADGSLGSVA